MTEIALYRLHIPAVQLQLISDAGMADTVKYNLQKIVLPNQFGKEPVHVRGFNQPSVRGSKRDSGASPGE